MLSIRDILLVVRERWRLELLIAGVIIAGVCFWIYTTPRIYSATTTLIFADALDPVKGTTVGDGDQAALLATQMDVIRSDLVSANVVKKLDLADARIIEKWQQSTGGKVDLYSWYGNILSGGLRLSVERSSRVLTIQYRSRDPQMASTLANAFADSYLEQRLELQTDPARTYARWFKDRTREVRASLEEAQNKLTAFKRDTGIVDNASSDAAAGRLQELQTALTGAEVESADMSSRATGASIMPDVQNSGVIQGLRSEIASKSAELSQQSVALGPNHPARKALEAQIAELRAKLNSELATSASSLRAAARAASAKEGSLRRELAGQEAQILGNAEDRAEFEVLKRDVDSAQAAYDLVIQNLETMRLQAVAPTTNARRLDIATPPLFPSEPKMGIRLLLGTILAALVAIGTAIALQLWRPVIHSDQGLEMASGFPVLGSINFTKSKANSWLEEESVA